MCNNCNCNSYIIPNVAGGNYVNFKITIWNTANAACVANPAVIWYQYPATGGNYFYPTCYPVHTCYLFLCNKCNSYHCSCYNCCCCCKHCTCCCQCKQNTVTKCPHCGKEIA